MRVVSLNVGALETVEWEGRRFRTGFRKRPVLGRIDLRGVRLEGDHQGDPTVHGGPLKSVYAYPSEHYAFWRGELRRDVLDWGAFGENLTTEGWLESEARVGDVVRIGSAELEVTRPRRPCTKLNAAFARPDMIERFHRAGRSGFYLGALRDGELGAGDGIQLLRRRPDGPAISDIVEAEREEEGPLGR